MGIRERFNTLEELIQNSKALVREKKAILQILKDNFSDFDYLVKSFETTKESITADLQRFKRVNNCENKVLIKIKDKILINYHSE